MDRKFYIYPILVCGMKYLVFVLVLLLFLASCQSGDGKDLSSAVLDRVNKCDDGNQCTVDLLDAGGKCIYSTINNCCGNNICEVGEGCNTLTQTTTCNKDCQLCPPKIKTKFAGCIGECRVNPDAIVIKGSSDLYFEVENSGEADAKINSEFSCAKIAQGVGKINFAYYGLNQEVFISNNNAEAVVKGKSKLRFGVKLSGKPNALILLECNANFKYGTNNILEVVFLRLEP